PGTGPGHGTPPPSHLHLAVTRFHKAQVLRQRLKAWVRAIIARNQKHQVDDSEQIVGQPESIYPAVVLTDSHSGRTHLLRCCRSSSGPPLPSRASSSADCIVFSQVGRIPPIVINCRRASF